MKGMPERIAKYHAVIPDFWSAWCLQLLIRNPDMSSSQFRKLLLGDRKRISTTCLTESNGSRRRNSASVDLLQRQLLGSNCISNCCRDCSVLCAYKRGCTWRRSNMLSSKIYRWLPVPQTIRLSVFFYFICEDWKLMLNVFFLEFIGGNEAII